MPEPRITIALTRYTEPNTLLHMTLESLAQQQGVAADILVLDQKENHETRDYIEHLNSKHLRFVYQSIPVESLSFARNTAIERSISDIILFIDSDAIADPHWARELMHSLLKDGVALAGGKIVPLWHKRPLLVASSGFVMDQYSMLDLGDREIPSTKLVGANFGINRRNARHNAYFNVNLGRRPGELLGGEESELANRVLKDGGTILYNGRARIQHQVLPERIRYAWLFKRIYWQGRTRASTGGKAGASNRLRVSDYLFAPMILPFYLAGYISVRYFRSYGRR